MKQRFSSIDVKAVAHELQGSLASLRLTNVYDLSSRILLFKFAKPNNKQQLLVDTGFRCHLTDFSRATAQAPSAFVARLRKALKTRRVTSVAQIGTDRVLEFQFSEGQYRLYLEFFASGNIILTDADLKILAISRNVSEGDGQEAQKIGLTYSLDNRQNYDGVPPLTKERITDALNKAAEKAAASIAAGKKLKGKANTNLRRALAVSIAELPPVLIDHALNTNNIDPTQTPVDALGNEAVLDELTKALTLARETVDHIGASPECKGYIFATRKENGVVQTDENEEAAKRNQLLYDDFHPFVPLEYQDDPKIEVLEFDNYNKTVDEFFSSLEGQKLESRLSEREATAQRKIDAAKQDQAKRIEGLQEVQTLNFRKAAAIEANVERVQEAMDAVNGLLAQGMDWVDIGKLVEREKKRHNPVAEVIKLPLNLSENMITIQLAEEEFEEEEQEDPFETDESESDEEDDTNTRPTKNKQASAVLSVEVSLGLSPWSNAREYYDQRRTAAAKEEKTQSQSAKALKNTEKKVTEDLKKGLKQEKALLQPIRKPMWFEKFLWFISSDGYLVIGGRDAQQHEMLYRKYLRKGDIYCHADLRGASNIIVKNNPSTPDAPIPPATLSQAGSLSVCSSEAWDSKAGMGAWWVSADQVSKSAPTGEFLPAGSFMVRGEKNFLAPAQLLLGLGMMFKISEDSKARHVKHRLQDEDWDGSSKGAAEKQNDEPQTTTGLATAQSKGDEADTKSVDDDYASEDESEAEESKEKPRDNPLQFHGQDSDEEEVDEAETSVSKLYVTDTPATDESKDETIELDHESDAETDAQPPTESVADGSTSVDQPDNASVATSGATASSKQGPYKRGQKAKAKKIAKKYKHQDEEDRAAAEALIGAAAGKKKKEAEAKAKVDREAELELAKERRRKQHQQHQKKTAEHEEIRRVMMDEGVEMLDADEEERTTTFDDLVGTPLPGDEIIEIIPVCAPWAALGKFKYKAKMQPGPVKKGKGVKEVLERWKSDSGKKAAVDDKAQDTERMWPREVELIKALKPEEIVNVVPVGKLKVMMAGGAAGGGGGGGKGGKGKGGGRGGKGSKRK